MTLKEYLENYDKPLNEDFKDKVKTGFKNFKEGVKFTAALGTLILALFGFVKASGTAISNNVGKFALKNSIETLQDDARELKKDLIDFKEKLSYFDEKDAFPEVQNKIKNQILASYDVIDNANKVLREEGKNVLSSKSLEKIKKETEKVRKSIKITNNVMKEAETEFNNNKDVYDFKKWKEKGFPQKSFPRKQREWFKKGYENNLE